ASHKANLKDPKKKAAPLLIPYGRFTKMIIYYLGSTSDVHKRPESLCHLPGDDFLLGNLKFISKGETDEVFVMAIPKQLITQAIQQSSYYPKYLEMVAKNTKKTLQYSASKQAEPATKHAPPKKPTTTTPVKPTKPPSSKQPKSPTKKPSKREGDDPALELAKKMSLDAHQEKGEGEGTDADIERAIKGSKATAPKGDKEEGKVASYIVTLGAGISVRIEDQAGSDPGKAHKVLAGPDPEPMQEDQTGLDSGKMITDEHVIKDNPESHYGSMSSMKNLEDTDNFGDQFLNDKPTKDDQEKSKVIDKSDSTIPDPNMSEVKKTDQYLGTKLDDALLRILERHTADLIEKYFVLPDPESIKNQESRI
ncbi:hypothetical protein Tco_0832550, partial [Tanacetum coccineum]